MARIESVGKAMHRAARTASSRCPITANPTLDGPLLQKNELDERLAGGEAA